MSVLDGKVILVVDDEPLLRELIADSFNLMDANTIQASGGYEALAMCKDLDVDLIISDIRMPEGNGVEFFESLRSFKAEVPFIFMTGFSDYSREDLISRGAKDVLTKPFDITAVIKMVESILR